MLDIQKVPLQGSYSVPAESALVFYCNVKVKSIIPPLPPLVKSLRLATEGGWWDERHDVNGVEHETNRYYCQTE